MKEVFYSYLPSCLSPLGDFRPRMTSKEETIALASETGYFHIQATKPDTVGTIVMQFVITCFIMQLHLVTNK